MCVCGWGGGRQMVDAMELKLRGQNDATLAKTLMSWRCYYGTKGCC